MAQQLGLRGSGCLACGGTPRVLGRMREGVTMGGAAVYYCRDWLLLILLGMEIMKEV